MVSCLSRVLSLLLAYFPFSVSLVCKRYFGLGRNTDCVDGNFIGSRSRNPLALVPRDPSEKTRIRTEGRTWQIGDRVSVDVVTALEAPKSQQIGVIRSINRGWYTIALDIVGSDRNHVIRAPQEASLVKCRASQLHPCTFASKNSTEVLSPELSPAPIIVDLDACIQQNPDNFTNSIDGSFDTDQLQYFQTFKEWVVFTDLHCSPRTIETCVEVLLQVHSIAKKRNAGILFLGDFWHIRSHSIRIDCLNRILTVLEQNFTQPMMLIPGNHDQISSSLFIEQTIHSLSPLQNAYRIAAPILSRQNFLHNSDSTNNLATRSSSINGILILARPTIFMNASFIPYIRNPSVLESILREASVSKAVFCHVDVTGASMNDNVVSRGGISIHAFPPNIPIYSGHFHKPHNVTSKSRRVTSSDVNKQIDEFRCVEYLGSPYQVSLSEAQQEKFVVLVDASSGWKCYDRIPIQIGRRHFRPKSLSEFLALQVALDGPVFASTFYKENDSKFFVKSGDRVVFSIQKYQMDELRRKVANEGLPNLVDQHVSLLRSYGVIVEIRELASLSMSPNASSQTDDSSMLSISNSLFRHQMNSDLSASSIWAAFLMQEGKRGTISSSLEEILLCKGNEILDEIGNDEMDSLATTMNRSAALSDNNFQLHTVTVRGFGPFSDEVNYPLFNRGLVLVRGFNKDGGSDSNGSGKTSLAMSVLWALTGSVDPRPSLGAKVSDIVNDSSTAASVTVQGALNGVDFLVTRTKTLTKGSLVFVFNGVDLSRQSIKDTQEMINEKLGICPHVLARTMFHGQHAMNNLLESTDSELKDELSLVVPLAVWQKALVHTRQKVRSSSKRLAELDGMISVRSDDTIKYKMRLEEAESFYLVQRQAYEETKMQLKEKTAFHDSVPMPMENIQGHGNSSCLIELEGAAREIGSDIAKLEKELELTYSRSDNEMKKMEYRIDGIQAQISQLDLELRVLEQKLTVASVQDALAKERIAKLEDTWKLDLTTGAPISFQVPKICPTCQQSISILSEEDRCTHDELAAIVRIEIELSLAQLSEAHSCMRHVQESTRLVKDARAILIANLRESQSDLDTKRIQWHDEIQLIEKQLQEARKEQQIFSSLFTAAAKELDDQLRINSLESSSATAKQALDFAGDLLQNARKEWSDVQQVVAELNLEKENQTNTLRILNDLCDGFGPRGIQSFIMQDAISMLASSAQAYLDELSDGSQRLELSIDSGDCISRRAYVRGSNGVLKERPLASLSGGQWRRCSLALALAFADLVSNRANFRPSICVFDEPLLHLDQSGRANVGRVLRTLLRRDSECHVSRPSVGFHVSTILIILQDLAAEELEESFDCVDEVVKEGGISTVLVDF